MSRSQNVIANFNNGLNCCQCVLLAFSEELGLDKKAAIKIALGFGGGMCHGEVCGAVTGAVMVLSLKYGNSILDDIESKEKVYEMVREFKEKFTEINDSIICRDLLGIDLIKKENRIMAREKGLFKKCPKFVEDSIDVLETML
ncbi:c_gcaxxg_c_c family protein [Clostridium carboxidivorans P7]|uniref:C_GCAxxG_C_C family protein n=1 Tax=Clostridium carboxidivorans P7 TaxID=536227 RepID=C6PZ21_9CLOT|nr:C-GCAxxG-C-C family protein [Clostridium carboxidivorans]AKN31402.1 c_gcaxxg_c_c family protein [Clostridium carboxidivorans P7]EET85507.1 C_GCAxxG_C_C family protein [Clostridium carboxidivorans P7]EFG87207.1 C_GCAxxG_C_C family protein [Clostridium carboxidivorans P7]